MMWTWKYFANWDLEKGAPEQLLTESEAKEREEELEPYVVVVTQDGQPRYVVDIRCNSFSYGLIYLDKNRKAERMDFYTIMDAMGDDDFLFLESVIEWKRVEGVRIQSFYQLDGSCRRLHHHLDTDECFKEETVEYDLAYHVRETVSFGDYRSLLPEVKETTTDCSHHVAFDSKESVVS
jgi:hypothetical protein